MKAERSYILSSCKCRLSVEDFSHNGIHNKKTASDTLETSCRSKANKNENLPASFKILMLNIPNRKGINEIQNAKSH